MRLLATRLRAAFKADIDEPSSTWPGGPRRARSSTRQVLAALRLASLRDDAGEIEAEAIERVMEATAIKCSIDVLPGPERRSARCRRAAPPSDATTATRVLPLPSSLTKGRLIELKLRFQYARTDTWARRTSCSTHARTA